MKELWKDITGYEGLYQVSNFGRVRSLDRIVVRSTSNYIQKMCILKLSIKKSGYLQVGLSKDSNSKGYLVHRLVAQEFLGLLINDASKIVNHINYDKIDNRFNNLEITSVRENNCHKYLVKNRTSNYIGVSWCMKSKKWVSKIGIGNKSIHLGTFIDEKDAYNKRCEYEKDNNITNKYK